MKRAFPQLKNKSLEEVTELIAGELCEDNVNNWKITERAIEIEGLDGSLTRHVFDDEQKYAYSTIEERSSNL